MSVRSELDRDGTIDFAAKPRARTAQEQFSVSSHAEAFSVARLPMSILIRADRQALPACPVHRPQHLQPVLQIRTRLYVLPLDGLQEGA